MKRLPLHRRTRQILSELSQKFGTEIPWADLFAEIAELDESVRKCFEPAELDALAILDAPVEVGGTKFYALTLNAEDWFEEWCRVFPDAPEMQMAGFLYASAHSMEPEALLRTWNDKFKLAEEVWAWRAKCGVKRGQIAPLQRLLMPETPWPRREESDGDVEREGYSGYGWMTAVLCKLKPDPEYWRNKVPFLKAMQHYRDVMLYADGDTDLRNARWKLWQNSAQMEEAIAIKRLKAAWEALQGPGDAPPSSPKPEEDKRTTEAPEGDSGATADVAPKPAEDEVPTEGTQEDPAYDLSDGGLDSLVAEQMRRLGQG